MLVSTKNIIEKQLDQFFKKYYLNDLIRGTILFFLSFLILGISIVVIEYFSFLSKEAKIVLLTLFGIFNFVNFNLLIIKPILQISGLFRKINYYNINKIINQEFPFIKDKLINYIELRNIEYNEHISNELIISSINQKIEDLKEYSFTKAIKLKKNIRFILYLLTVVFLFLLISALKPGVYKNTSYRLIHYNEEFSKSSPYTIKILNESLKTGKDEDFLLRTFISSQKEIENFTLAFWGNQYKMEYDSAGYYHFKFSNVNNDINFSLYINDNKIDNYTLQILKKPILTQIDIEIIKPVYTQLKKESYTNLNEIIVPVGSKIKFSYATIDTDTIILSKNEETIKRLIPEKNIFLYEKQFLKDEEFSISLKNENFILENYLTTKVKTIRDEYPFIKVEKQTDSLNYTLFWFRGLIRDDYGFNSLKYHIKILDKIDTSFTLNIINNLNEQEFYYAFDFIEYKGINTIIESYFEISDNDQINGAKSTISELFTFKFPDQEEIINEQNNAIENIEELLTRSKELTEGLKNDFEIFQEKLINTSYSEWEKKEQIKSIISEKEKLEKILEQIEEKNNELNNYLESFTDLNEELLEKQRKIKELLENVFSEEMKKLLDEFNKLMNEFNKEKANQLNKEMEVSLDDLSKQLDKNIELLKRMQIEQNLHMINEQIKQLAEKQKNISERAKNNEEFSQLQEQTERNKKEFENIKEQYRNALEKNKDLEKPFMLFEFKNENENIDKEFQTTEEQIQKKNRKKSEQSINKNRENLDNYASMFQQMLDQAIMQQNSENLNDLLQILDNLVIFSFNQEKLILPNYDQNFSSDIFRRQKSLQSDFVIIQDSLYSLAKREPSINTIVNKEFVDINNSFHVIEQNFSDNQISAIKIEQQKILTSANNLALFLSEVIKQLQMQMSNNMPGNQNCNKPGNNPNPNSMGSPKNMQQGLQQQLEKIIQMMKEGKQGGSINSELGKALSQQEKLQKMLQQIMNQGNVGSEANETLKKANELLNSIKTDIIRNNVTENTVKRQQEIRTRLLEAENAQMEREKEEKRKSKTAEVTFQQKMIQERDNQQKNELKDEKLIKNRLIINNFYQNKLQNYVISLDSINGKGN